MAAFVLDNKSGAAVLIATFIGLYYSYWYRRKRKVELAYDGNVLTLERPPCLRTVPIFGSIPFLPSFPTMHKFFTERSSELKDVAAYYIMNKYRVVLNSREAIHEAFVKRSADFSSRPPGSMGNVFNPDQKGIVFHPYNDHFKKYHKLSLGIMKQFGFGNRIMEKRIMEEVVPLLETLSGFKGEEFEPTMLMTRTSMNIVCGILFGRRFDDDDPELVGIMENIRTSFSNLPKVFVLSRFPFLRHFSFFKRALATSVLAQEKVFAMLEGKIAECTDISYDRPNFIRSYLDSEDPEHDRDQLLHFMHEMFLVGTETTSSTLQWALALLANRPDVQGRMCSELARIGPQPASLEDKRGLPYCEAVLCETLRVRPVVPMSLPHVAERDTHVMGYHVPQGTLVFANLHSVHHDASTWGDPENFRPERFLDESGDLKTSLRDLLVPFSLGKRSCFGEMLAKQEVFLVLTNLIKRFLVLPPVGLREMTVTEVMDITCKPSTFRVRFVDREAS